MIISLLLVSPVSALSLDSVSLIIYDDGSANIYSRYDLSLKERILFQWLAFIFGDEEQLIKSKISELYGDNVEIDKLDKKSNKITLSVSDFINERKDFKDGYWMNYIGIAPEGNSFIIEDVRIIFPDGYVRTYNGKIPSDVHFVNNKLTSYYYLSQYYQTMYEKNYGVYDPNNYKFDKTRYIVGGMITGTGFYEFVITAGVKSIAVSSLPTNLQAISTLKDAIETITTGEPYTKLESLKKAKLMEKVVSESALVGYMSSDDKDGTRKKIAGNMKKMSELKTEEIMLLKKLLSETEEWDKNLDLLITNLNAQKNTLNELDGDANKMVNAVQYTKENNFFISVSEDGVSYLESISRLSQQISENDLKNVNTELEYLNSYK